MNKLTYIDQAIAEHIGSQECLEWPFGLDVYGYGRFIQDRQHYAVHRYVCIKWHGPPPFDDAEAAHGCGNRKCFNPVHLSWKTPLQNSQDRLIHGTLAFGSKVGTSKLTESEVVEIFELRGTMTQTAIARIFGVSQQTVSGIHTKTNWKRT